MKTLKFPDEDESFVELADKLAQAERKAHIAKEREPTDSEMEARFANYRLARAKERYGPAPGGILTYGDVWDDITDEEIDYYMRKHLRIPPEQRYEAKKSEWQWHESSWTARKVKTGYDGYGCSGEHGCIPSCRFYPATGRIEDYEVIAHYQERKRKRDSMTREEKRAARQRVHGNALVYDDD